eukprot:scaffold71012_cov64-Phaeocystis_antarctica.AAC.2
MLRRSKFRWIVMRQWLDFKRRRGVCLDDARNNRTNAAALTAVAAAAAAPPGPPPRQQVAAILCHLCRSQPTPRPRCFESAANSKSAQCTGGPHTS